jgi:hypothetical protein
MKIFRLLAYVVLVLLIFSACQKGKLLDDKGLEIKETSSFLVEDQMLSFSSKEEVKYVVNTFLNEEKQIESSCFMSELQNANFRALVKNTDLLKSAEIDVYITEGFDTLVPNREFARLLNSKGEFMVSDTVYKITPFGTYYFPKSRRERFYQIYPESNSGDQSLKSASDKEAPLGTLVSDRTYSIEDDIYRYDTFSSYQLQYYPPEDPGGGGSGGGSGGSGTTPTEPNYDSFRTFSYGAQTWFGSFFESIFGRNKGEKVEFASGRRRIKVNFYNYNYMGYKECGVTSTFQKRNWFGWDNSRADELRVGWRNVKLVVTPPIEIRATYPENPPKVVGRVLDDYVPGNDTKLWRMVELWEWDVTDQFNDVTKAALDLIKDLGKGLNKDIEVIKNYRGGEIEYYFVSDEKVGQNIEQLNHVFTTAFNANYNFTPDAILPSSLKSYALKLAQQQTALNFDVDIQTGEVYGCARLGSEWKGIRVIKEN